MSQMIVILLTRAVPGGLLYGGFLLAMSSSRFLWLLPLVVVGGVGMVYLINADAKRIRDQGDRTSKE